MNRKPSLLRSSAVLSLLIIVFAIVGCGGGSSISGGGPPPPPPPPPFTPRPFPGDFFIRSTNQFGGGTIASEVYNPVLKQLFISNPDVNGVDVYSTVDAHWVGEIPVPGPAGLGFTPDFSKLFIGTITPYVYSADPTTLHITGTIQLPASQLTDGWMPVVPFPMTDGSIFIGMGGDAQSSGTAFNYFTRINVLHVLRYDPQSTSFTPEDPTTTGLNAVPARTQDGRFLLVAAGGQLHLYSTAIQGYVAHASVTGVILGGSSIAANADGSQFAALTDSQLSFLGPALQAQNAYPIGGVIIPSVVYSRDGKYLYSWTPNNNLIALNTQTAQPAGYLGISIGSLPFPGIFWDADENYRVFGTVTAAGGALAINASQLQVNPPAVTPLFIGPSTAATPNVGPVAGGTAVQFISAPSGSGSADGIVSSTQAYFGTVPAVKDVVAPYSASSNGQNFLTATSPPSAAAGPVSVLLTDQNNNPVFLPDAFTYGPKILRVQPNLATTSDQITVFAYGLGFFDENDIKVSVGGTPVPPGNLTLNSYASAAFPEQSVSFSLPQGNPGWADITITTSNGSDTIRRGVQYLKNKVSLQGGPFSFAVYDSLCDRFYLTGSDNKIAVFDPSTTTFAQPLQSSAVGSSVVLQGEALTPDNAKLLVSDPSEHSVIVFDLTAGTSTSVNVLLPSDGSPTLSPPMSIAAAAGGKAFVSLTPCITNPVREINLASLTVTPRPDAATTCPAYQVYPQMGGSSADGSVIIYAGNSELQPPGAESVWRYDAATDSFTGPNFVFANPWVFGKAAANSDGTVLALGQGTLDHNLMPLLPLLQGGLDARLNDTGSLLYTVYGSVEISDTRSGLLRLAVNLPATVGPPIGPYRPLAIDAQGQKIVVATTSGVSYFQLAVTPLAIGTISPAQGTTGTLVTLRGSGFVAGTTAKIGGKSVACNVIDSETLSFALPALPSGAAPLALSNPDGQTLTFENAVVVN